MTKAIAVLGGGSVWTPYLIEQIAQLEIAGNLQVRLQGPNESHLNDVAEFSRRMVGESLDIKTSVNIEDAVRGASIVLNQARVGGLSARLDDEVIPVRAGAIGDESLGLGGLRAAIRTLPFVATAAKAVLDHAPDAHVLNLSNPSDLVSRAWRAAGGRRVISLCDYPENSMREIASRVDKPEAATCFGFVGVTHVGWMIPPRDAQLLDRLDAVSELAHWLSEWEAIPTTWRIHLSNPGALLDRQRQHPGQRARQLQELAEELRGLVRAQDVEGYRLRLLDRLPLWYSGMAAPAIRGLSGGEPARLVVGMSCDECLQGMNPGSQLESWALLDQDGVHREPIEVSQRCREDMIRLGQARDLAFDAMMNPSLESLDRYARSDGFTSFPSLRLCWSELLDLASDVITPRKRSP